MSKQVMLTTFDNPFDPFEDFANWFSFDIEKGYNCCSKLDRIANFSEDLTQTEIDLEKERAIDLIIVNDFTNTFTKAVKENTQKDLD